MLAPLAIHLREVAAPFFADDYLFVDQVRGRSLPAVIAAPDPIGNFFRPVGRQLWFWTVTRVFGESPGAFHALALVLFTAILVLAFALARRLAGERAALLATAFLAVHYAADVPLRWAAGSQDLLAVLGALGALVLHVRGRTALAALALFAGLLSKETVALTPLVAIALGRRDGEPWRIAARRAWPLFAALAAWAVLWTVRSPHPLAPAAGVKLDFAGALAALAHLVQVAVGWEARSGRPFGIALDPAMLAAPLVAILGVAIALRGARREARPTERRPAIGAGIAWALLGAAPVAAVASIWSAYYYLFAMAGVALALGAWLARRPTGVALAALALLGTGSAIGRSLDDFALAGHPWTGQSHLNRFYIDRALRESGRYLANLQRVRREFPPRSVVYFAGIKASVAFQTADGPMLRWAYRDPTLQSFYVNQFTRERVASRPVFLFYVVGDSLVEARPGIDTFGRIAFGFTLNDRLGDARAALAELRERKGEVQGVGYFEAWLAWATGDAASARGMLAQEGLRVAAGPAPQRPLAMNALGAGDTAQAIALMRDAVREYALDPRAHALLADLMLMVNPEGLEPAIETIAARALAPGDPYSWRRMAMLQIHRERYLEALRSLERYFALAGPKGNQDLEARRWADELRRRTPSSALAHEALRR